MNREIRCQNCGIKIAHEDDNVMRIDPTHVDFISQSLNADETLLTFSCPDCGCFVQVKH